MSKGDSCMKEVSVAITGAAGQIGYALLFRIAAGEMFGPETKVNLNLLELERALPALEGVKMELEDCAFPLLGNVTCTADQNVAFSKVDWALLVGSVPRGAGMERGDLIKINGPIFVGQGKAIADNANANCRVLVVGNPCNTNALIAKANAAGKIPAENFYAMTMLDQNRAIAQVAEKAGVETTDVSNMAIWGNHSATQFPNFELATIAGASAESKITDRNWWENDFMKTVQQRGAAIIKARGASSAASAANAVVDSVRNILTPTKSGEWFSLCVASKGEYGIPEGLIFSYPVSSDGNKVSVVEGLDLSAYAKEKIQITSDELVKERDTVAEHV